MVIANKQMEQKCILCNGNYEGMGHNPHPLSSEGRCCEKCNLNKVLPARLQQQSIDSLNHATSFATSEQIKSDEVFYSGMRIQPIDRLKNYQLTLKYWKARMENLTEDDFIQHEHNVLLKAYWKNSFGQSMLDAKPFIIEDEVIPLLLHTQAEEEELPFKSFFIDAKVKIKNRTYFGFHVGSYYTDKTNYRAILCVYSKYVKHKGEMVKILIPDFIILGKDTEEDLTGKDIGDYFHRKIRNFINSFCLFINEPDVTIIEKEVTPKNNKRRIEKGNMPLPSHKVVRIHGNLKLYVNKIVQESEQQETGSHSSISYRFWVRGFYRHYWNKDKYKHLYQLDDRTLKSMGYTYSQKYKGILRKWIKPFIKGQGLLIKQSWEVTE